MAGKGTYGAYVNQPSVPNGTFAGAQEFSQMATRKANEIAQEKAYQRQMMAEGRKALRNAVEAGNIDVSKFNSAVHGLLGKVLDAYGDRLVDASEALKDGYSLRDEMAIAKIRADFQSNVSTLLGLGNTIKSIQSMNLDPVLSLKAINGISEFIQRVPEFADKMDPHTLQLGGKHISQIFDELVPKTDLIEYVDTSKAFNEYGELVLSEPTKESKLNGNMKVTYELRDYDPDDARGVFLTNFPSKSNVFKKEAFHILSVHEGLEGEEKAQFEAKYLEKNAEGDFRVTPEKMFEYVKDYYLEPKRRRKIAEEEQRDSDSGLSAYQSLKAQEEVENNARKIEKLHEFATITDMNGLKDEEIEVDGAKGTIKEGGLKYNPLTGTTDIAVSYTLSTDQGTSIGRYVSRFSYDEKGIQALGNSVYKDFDYIFAKRQLKGKVSDSILEVPKTVLTFDNRRSDIDWLMKNQATVINDRLTRAAGLGDLREGKERVYEYIIQPFEEAGEENRALINFMATYLDIDKAVADGAGIDTRKYKLKKLDLDEGDSVSHSQRLSRMVLVARSMKARGKSEDEITRKLVAMAKGDTDYEFDRVLAYIDEKAGKSAEMRAKYRAKAESLLKERLTDDEIIERLDSWNPKKPDVFTIDDGGKKVDVPASVVSTIKNYNPSLDWTDEQALDYIKDFAKENGMTVSEVIKALTE